MLSFVGIGGFVIGLGQISFFFSLIILFSSSVYLRGDFNILSIRYPASPHLFKRSLSDVLRSQSRFVKFVGGEAAGRTLYTFYKHTLGPKYVSKRP